MNQNFYFVFPHLTKQTLVFLLSFNVMRNLKTVALRNLVCQKGVVYVVSFGFGLLSASRTILAVRFQRKTKQG